MEKKNKKIKKGFRNNSQYRISLQDKNYRKCFYFFDSFFVSNNKFKWVEHMKDYRGCVCVYGF